MRVNPDLGHIITQHTMVPIFEISMVINYRLFVIKNSNSNTQQIRYSASQTTHLLLCLSRGVLFVVVAQEECRCKSFLLYQQMDHVQVLP